MSSSDKPSSHNSPLPIDVTRVLVPPEVIARIPGAMARRHGILPVALRDDCLDIVAASDDVYAVLMQL